LGSTQYFGSQGRWITRPRWLYDKENRHAPNAERVGFYAPPNLQSAAHVPMPGFVRHHDFLHSRQDCFDDEYGIDNEKFR
jgi:hypothetical protein